MPEEVVESPSRDSRLAQHLVASGRLPEGTVERAMRVGENTSEPLSGLLLKLGLLAERDLAAALADLHGLQIVPASEYPDKPVGEGLFSSRFLREAKVLPLAIDNEAMDIVMADPGDTYGSEAVRMAAGLPVRVHVGLPTEIEQAIDRLYGGQGQRAETEAESGTGLDEALETDIDRLRDLASEAPVVRLVNRIIADALELRASDIHLEPFENRIRLRYRIDGVLQEGEAPPLRLKAAIVSRIKIMARLDIAERRLPQDGRIKLAIKGTAIDLRVSTLPSIHGEGVAMRVLDKESVSLDFDALGISGDALARLLRGLDRPNGIFLVTGPTGSGKTTTLYAALARLNSVDRKIIAVEDPVEYQLEGINQIQVKPQIGLSFASVLRAILRQDPDIILIGEIRDLETAQIAAQAALTGHLVLSTLHTNSAAASVTRLLDMGVEDYLVTATLNGVAAQRLVRKLCPHCREPYRLEDDLAAHLGLARLGIEKEAVFHRAKGCVHCNGSGYRGRTAIVETLIVDDATRRAIIRGGDAGAVAEAAISGGMRTLYEDGLRKALDGITSLEDVLRATRES